MVAYFRRLTLRYIPQGFVSFIALSLLCACFCTCHDVPTDLYAPATTPCKRCSLVHTSTLDECWADFADHFAEQVELSVNRYALALQYVTRWRAYHNDDAGLYAGFTRDRYGAVLDRLYPPDPNEHGAHGPLDKEDLAQIFSLVLNRTSLHDAVYADEEWPMPGLQCPVPCEYEGEMYKTLFIITAVGLVLTLVAFTAHVCWRSTKMDNPHALLVNTPL